jgi:hypothetical protein
MRQLSAPDCGTENYPANQPSNRPQNQPSKQPEKGMFLQEYATTPHLCDTPLNFDQKSVRLKTKKSPQIKDLEAEIWWVVLDSNQRPIG